LARSTEPWAPPLDGDPLPWSAIDASLRIPHRGPDPHKLSPRIPEQTRRAAVAVVLWGDGGGARKLVLVQRGHTAPQHPGELAFPGGMVEAADRDLRATARRELAEELGVREDLWEIGCFPDGVAKARIRFTPVLFRWEAAEPGFVLDHEIHAVLMVPLRPLMDAPWTTEIIDRYGLPLLVPRLELPEAPLWGATALVLKAWLDVLEKVL
jgi:8-oxo-dGTP pyrophosphatase MutT (NUDIX family)